MKIIKLAFRSILRFRMYSGVNLLGMALSLACVITIFRYVQGEMTVDHFNKKLDRIYVTAEERNLNSGDAVFRGSYNPNTGKTNTGLVEHPGVEKYSNFVWFDTETISVDEHKYNATVLMTDSNFLKIMDYHLLTGTANLSEPSGALITKRFAQNLFGNQNPVGKTIQHSTGLMLTVTGVIGQPSTKSTLAFDVVVPFMRLSSWPSPQTLVLLYPGVDYKSVNSQYAEFTGEISTWISYQTRYQLFPLGKVYFNSSISNFVFKQGNFNYVKILIAVGFLILFIGVINYINIYTVVVLRRGKELGIKKVFGAGKYSIFNQLLVENVLMASITLIAAFFIVGLANPLIKNVLLLEQIPDIRFDILLSSVLVLSLPVITTLYPFYRCHYRTPVNTMNNFGRIKGAGKFRNVFLSFQNILTIVMVVVSLFFIKQLKYMLDADLGYRTEDIIKVKFFNAINIREELVKAIKIENEITQKLNASPLFSCWSYGSSPNEFREGSFQFRLPEGENKTINLTGTDEKWFRLFDIPLLEGRIWDDEIENPYDYNIIVTESVLKLYGITDFRNALLQPDRRIWLSSETPELDEESSNTNPPYRIVGVIKDFDYLHLSKNSDPVAFFYSKGDILDNLMASIVPGRKQEAIEFLRNLHNETVGGEFAYSFVEDEVRAMYKEDKKIATVYSIFTFLAIFISALGLFSMSLFDIQQRRKEIAIRKVNGAMFIDVIRLLLKRYFGVLTISFVFSTPIALFAIQHYLENFAHKAAVSWWLFAAAVTLTAGVSLLTLLYQTQKAARQNPAEVVKND